MRLPYVFRRFSRESDSATPSLMGRLLVPLLVGLMVAVSGCTVSGQFAADDHSHDPKHLINKTWQWHETVSQNQTLKVKNPERYTLRFGDDDQVKVRFDCNQGGGTYRLQGESLRFGPLISTRMACADGSLDTTYMRQLQGVGSFFIREDDLYLELRLETGTMRFMVEPET